MMLAYYNKTLEMSILIVHTNSSHSVIKMLELWSNKLTCSICLNIGDEMIK